MTPEELYGDEWADEDDMYDRLAELEEEAAERAEEDHINATISGLEESFGVELTDAQAQTLGSLIDEHGFDPIQAWESLDLGPDDLETEYHDLAERIEEDHGRSLSESERDRLWEANLLADREGHDEVDVSGALYDLDSSEGRADFIGEKLRVEPEETEPSANVLDPETGESKPGYDLDRGDQRSAAIDALMAGEDVAAYDSSYETIEGD